jgi:hypothetical protein
VRRLGRGMRDDDAQARALDPGARGGARRARERDAEQRADGGLDGLCVEEPGPAVGDHQRVRACGADGPDDRAEIARPFDPFRNQHEGRRPEREGAELGRPARDDGEESVRTRAAGDGLEGGGTHFQDGGGVERVHELAVALGQERPRIAAATQPPECLQARVAGAGDRELSCHGSCFRGADARGHEATSRLGRNVERARYLDTTGGDPTDPPCRAQVPRHPRDTSDSVSDTATRSARDRVRNVAVRRACPHPSACRVRRPCASARRPAGGRPADASAEPAFLHAPLRTRCQTPQRPARRIVAKS